MASELIARLLTDADRGPVIRRTGQFSWRGRKTFRVNTHEQDDAVFALGLPGWGERWSAGIPTAIVSGMECRFVHGTNDPATETGGYCEVEVEYETPGDGSPLPPAVEGTAYTEIEAETSSINVRMDIRGPSPGGVGGASDTTDRSVAIEDGRGVTRRVGRTVFMVSVFPTSAAPIPLETMRSMQAAQVVNENEIELPGLLGTNYYPKIGVGQAQYEGFRIGRENGLLKATHIIAAGIGAAPDADAGDPPPPPLEQRDPQAAAYPAAFYFWRTEDAKGRPVGRLRASKVYQTGPFPQSLWPANAG